MIEKAKLDYMNGMKYKDLAEKYNVSINTVKSWVSRNGWAKEKRGAHKKEKGAHKKKTVITATKNEDKVQEKIIEEVAANSNLTDKQQLFCIYYLKYFNATKAYQKSYGCSYNTAMVEGHRSLRKPNIKLEIERLKAERLKGIYLDSKEILQQYIDIAFTDITDYVEFGVKEQQVIGGFGPLFDSDDKPIMQEVNYVEFKDSTEVDGSLINEISLGKNGASIKLHDKMKALDWLAKNLPKINEVDLDKELLAAKVEKEKAMVEKIKNEINADVIEPISIEIVKKDKR